MFKECRRRRSLLKAENIVATTNISLHCSLATSLCKLANMTEKSAPEKKTVIKNVDMCDEMQQDAIDCAQLAMEKFNIEKDIAAYIKKDFDKKHNPTWHCICGRNFGSYVTHETRHFIYFYIGQIAVLLFKSG